MYQRILILLALVFVGCKTAQVTSENQDETAGFAKSAQTDSLEYKSEEQLVEKQGNINYYHPIKDYRAAKARQFDLLHTKLVLSFSWQKEQVNGIANLKLVPYFYPQDLLILDAKKLAIEDVFMLEGTSKNKLAFEFVGDQVFISLPRLFSRNEEINVEIVYSATPGKRQLSGSDAIASDQGLYFINADKEHPHKPSQIWTQGETEANSAWFPTIDSPNERSTQEMYLTVPDSMTTLSNGTKVSTVNNNDGTKTDYWRMDKPHAPYLFMLAIGDFVRVDDDWNDIPLGYYVEPQYQDFAKSIFRNTPEMIDYFSEVLDYPFPWAQYNQIIVRDYVSGAMENTTASLFMEELQMTDKELLDTNWDYIIAHELFHQWFGDLVTCESWSNLPLNESFADFSEWLWIDHKYGRDEGDYHAMIALENYLEAAKTEKKDLIRFYYEDKEDLFDRHSYEKGGAILRMLKTYVGDEAFFGALNYYLKKNAFQSVEIHDLRLAFEKITGEDLNWFFNQWFLDSGHPVLTVQESFVSDTLSLVIKQTQDLDSFPLFKIPMYIDIYEGDQVERFPVVIGSKEEVINIPMNSKPSLVVVDGEQELVGEVQHVKSEEQLLYQLQYVPNLIAKHRAFEGLAETNNLETMKKALQLALSDSSFRITTLALDFLQSAPDYLINVEIREMVEQMLRDEKSDVRAGALYALIEYSPEQYRAQIVNAVQDKAYSVQGVALEGVLLLEEVDEDEIFADFLKERQIDVMLPTANYLNQKQDKSFYAWYEERILKSRGTDLFYLLQYFAEFIVNTEEEVQKKALPLLKNIAIDNPDFFTRYTAFQIIYIMSETLDLKELLEEIKEKETNEELVSIYDRL